MNNASLPEKYRFDTRLLEDYLPGDKFPNLSLEGGITVVSKLNHPLAGFMQFYIDNVINYISSDGVWDNLIDPASKEMAFLNEQKGIPQMGVPSPNEMEEKRYHNAIERLKLYISELENAINYAISKEVPSSEWPFKYLIEQKEKVNKELKMILEGEGKQNFIVLRMG